MTEYETSTKGRLRPPAQRTRRRRALAAGAGVALLGGLVALPTTGAAANGHHGAHEASGSYRVIASGLDNPRHLSYSGGKLYVAESGKGGAGPCVGGAEGGEVCYGTTGAITELTRSWRHWRQHRTVTGLPSLAGADGSQATGPSDVEVRGNRYVVSVGLGANPAARAELGKAGSRFGTLLQGRLRHHHSWHHRGKHHRSWHHKGRHHHGWHHRHGFRVLADIAQHEADTNPIADPDSNPASVLRVGSRYLVADAGGNTVVMANRWGRVKTLAAFANGLDQPTDLADMQFVPTSAVVGPDGALYVSQLTGFPFPKGASKIYRLARGHAPEVYATGLTNVTDLAFGRDGSLYAVQIASNGLLTAGDAPPVGSVVKVARAGHGTNKVIAENLTAPYGIALGSRSAYVTTGGVLAGEGEVIQIPLRHRHHGHS